MIDPKTAWMITKMTFRTSILLIKSAALISMIYFAVFTVSFFEPFFNNTNNTSLIHEAKLVYICCYIVIGFLALLIGEQLAGMVLSLVPGSCSSIIRKPEALWFRISYIIVVGLLLGASFLGTLYPLLKALAWRDVFSAAGRADLEQQATALVVFMGMTLVVGILSLSRLSWGLFVQCCGASKECCCRRSKKGDMERKSSCPLQEV